MSAILGFLVISIGLLLSGCEHHHPPPSSQPSLELGANVMTIDYRILIGDPTTVKEKAKIQLIIDNVFHHIDMTFNKWNPLSEVSQLNALPANSPKEISPELFHFLEKVDTLVALSDGRFDPTIEPLYQLWKDKLEKNDIPTTKEIEAIRPCIGWDKINFDQHIFTKKNQTTELDFGGVVKGWCVDLLIQQLNSEGFKNIYVEWGGEIRTTGYHPSGRPWRIFISNLGNQDHSHAIAQLDLSNQALATSGDYYQNWTIRFNHNEKKHYSHLMNPITLSPQEINNGSIASSSLLANDCLTADALAKVPMLFTDLDEANHWIENLQKKYPEMVFWIQRR